MNGDNMQVRFRPLTIILTAVMATICIRATNALSAMERSRSPRVAIVQQTPDSVRVAVSWAAPATVRGVALVGYTLRAQAPHFAARTWDSGTSRSDTVWVARDSVQRVVTWDVRARSNPAGDWPWSPTSTLTVPARPVVTAPGAPQVQIVGTMLSLADSFRVWPPYVALDSIGADVQLAVVVWYPSPAGSTPTVCARHHDGSIGWAEVVLTGSSWAVPAGTFAWLADPECGPVYAEILPPGRPAQRGTE